MIKLLAKKVAVGLENNARKSVAREKANTSITKVFFGAQELPKELR